MAGRGDGSRSSFARVWAQQVCEGENTQPVVSLERGRAEGGRQENQFPFRASLSKQASQKESGEMPPSVPPTPLVPALEQPAPRQRIGPLWSVSSGGNHLEKCKASFQVPIPWMNRGSVAGTDITIAPLDRMGNIAFNE